MTMASRSPIGEGSTATPDSVTSSRNDAASQPRFRADPLIRVEDLVCTFKTGGRKLTAVDGVSFDVLPGETLGLVGESGCGKTTTGRAIMQLSRPSSGKVWFEGQELGSLSRKALRDVRRRLQMIFQDPLSSLNPRRRVIDIVGEGLSIAGVSKPEISARVDEVLEQVGLSRETIGERRPHQLSGGQAQRIAIARALALRPKLIVCDEPVASLDVSVQAQVLNVLHQVKESNDLSLIFVSHDLAVVRNVSDRIAVMYLGQIVECGEADAVFSRPAHPYTRQLLASVPGPGEEQTPASTGGPSELPSLFDPPSGCRFRTRCPKAVSQCAEEEPAMRQIGEDHFVSCHFPHDEPAPVDIAPTPRASG